MTADLRTTLEAQLNSFDAAERASALDELLAALHRIARKERHPCADVSFLDLCKGGECENEY